MPDTDRGQRRWTEIGAFSPSDLIDPGLELHWALQLLASVGQTFAEPAPDDSHRATVWSEGLAAFVSAPFASPYPLRVALRPADLTLLIIDRTDAPVAALPLPGQSLDEAHEWLGLAAATYFGGAPPLLERPEYDMPSHPVEHGARFSNAILPELGALAALYGSAAVMITAAVKGRDDASETRCWPRHFDLASLLTVERDDEGAATRTVGLGLAPAGAGFEEWYWYVSPWPAPDPETLPTLRAGVWNTDGWTRAVLTGGEVLSLAPPKRAAAVEAFLNDAIEAALRARG